MLMFQLFMDVLMFVMLSQVQPDTETHQEAGSNEL